MEVLEKSQEILIRNIGRRLETLGWKAKDLSKASGLSLQWAYAIIKGERWPGPDNLDRLAKALGVNVADLFVDDTRGVELKKPSAREALDVIREHLEKTEKQLEIGSKTETDEAAELVSILATIENPKLLAEVTDVVKRTLSGLGLLDQAQVKAKKHLGK